MENMVEGDDDFAEEYLPIEFLLDNHKEELKREENSEGIVLFCGKAKRNHRGRCVAESIAVSFMLRHGRYEAYDDGTIEQLRKFFSYLHPIITGPSIPKLQELPVMSPRVLLEYRMRAPTPLFAALFSLGSGTSEPESEKIVSPDHPTFQNQALAAIVASGALIRSSMRQPSEGQLMFGDAVAR